MTDRDYFVVTTEIDACFYQDTEEEITDFRMSDYKVTDPSYYDNNLVGDIHDAYYTYTFRYMISKEKISNHNLYKYLDFHYNHTIFKSDFLDMIEFDILAKSENDVIKSLLTTDDDYRFSSERPPLMDITRKLRVEKWLKLKRATHSPFVIEKGDLQVPKPLAIHWALFFKYWYETNRINLSVLKASKEFHTLFNPPFKSETIRKKHRRYLFIRGLEKEKYQNDIKFIIEQFSHLDKSWIESAKKDILP
jgi:hypothetical protein